MGKKFFTGIAVIFMIYAGVSWGIVQIAAFGAEKIQGLVISGILATANVISAYLILQLSMPKGQKAFAKIFLSGMVARLLGMLAVIFIVFKYSDTDHFVFIGSLFILYFMYQIWEVLTLNSKKNKG